MPRHFRSERRIQIVLNIARGLAPIRAFAVRGAVCAAVRASIQGLGDFIRDVGHGIGLGERRPVEGRLCGRCLHVRWSAYRQVTQALRQHLQLANNAFAPQLMMQRKIAQFAQRLIVDLADGFGQRADEIEFGFRTGLQPLQHVFDVLRKFRHQVPLRLSFVPHWI